MKQVTIYTDGACSGNPGPGGWCAILEYNGIEKMLSGGEAQKIVLARALAKNAPTIVLDEPTSGLDPVSRDELTELFRAIVADGSRSILFSTHITSDLEKCADHITFIKDGEIFYTGAKADFLTEYAHLGTTLEEIIVAAERRPLDAGSII